MTEEAQRIAIAKACGWTKDSRGWITPDGKRAEHNEMLDVSYRVVQHECPDYLHDLNAIHEAEKVLMPEQQHIFYEEAIRVVTGYGYRSLHHQNTRKIVSATAAQRAEAFLRTLGLWVEEKVEV